jgi:hypothetical protein
LLFLNDDCRVEDRPKFPGDRIFPVRAVVVVEANEAQQNGIEPGYYVSPLSPTEVRARLAP